MSLKKLIKARADKAKAFADKRAAYNALVGKADRTADEETRLEAMNGELDAAEVEIRDLDAQIVRAQVDERRAALLATPSALSIGAGARFTSYEPDPARTNGFRSIAEFATSVRAAGAPGHAGVVDERLNAATPSQGMTNSGAAGEGYLVPLEFRQQIWDLVFGSQFDLMQYFSPESTSSNGVEIAKDETTPWGATGVQAVWRSEATQMNASKLALSGARVPLHELFAFVAATEEVLNDAPLMQSRLSFKAAQAIAYRVSDAIVWGDGVGKPLGWMKSGALVTQSAEGGQTSGTIVLDNVTKMRTRMMAGALARSMWIANIEIEPQLLKLQVGNMPVMVPVGSGLREGLPNSGYMLNGRPLIYAEQGAALGTPGDLMLVSPENYYLLTKAGGGIDFAASIHLFFDYNMTAFRWIFRVGGQPFLSAPVSPARGATTKSHFVALAAR